ncbi:MAG: energy transducer TonB [Zoogloeaceae bacterium]|jgi:protein TonB|nr:energy transducer TonB [Zoogloeaceae bacterium]
MLSRRFLLALAASLALHLPLLGLGLPGGEIAPRKTAISAHLLPPVTVQPTEPLLKDTLAEPVAPTPPAPPADARRHSTASRPAQPAAQPKLSPIDFYPPEAIARGIEGEVRLLLTLDADGTILAIDIAASSGHAILDEAAIKAARATARLPEAGAGEMILPVVFKLRR